MVLFQKRTYQMRLRDSFTQKKFQVYILFAYVQDYVFLIILHYSFFSISLML